MIMFILIILGNWCCSNYAMLSYCVSNFQPCSLNFLRYSQIRLILHYKSLSVCYGIMGMALLWMVLDCKLCWMKEWWVKMGLSVLGILVPVVVYLLFAQLNFITLVFFYLLSFTVEWFSNFLYFSKMSLFRTLCC